jgi:hypothetical protein
LGLFIGTLWENQKYNIGYDVAIDIGYYIGRDIGRDIGYDIAYNMGYRTFPWDFPCDLFGQMMIGVPTHGFYFGHSMPPTLTKSPKLNIYIYIYAQIIKKYIFQNFTKNLLKTSFKYIW